MKKIQFYRENRSKILVLGAAALVAFPHLVHLPRPITLFYFLLLGWRLLVVGKPYFLPGKKLLLILTLLAVILLISVNQGILGRHAGSSALLVALGLKLMEMRTERDSYVIVFLAFFVALTQFLFNQSMVMATYILMVSWFLVATLISLNSGSLKTPSLFKISVGIILQALPIAIFLFFLFPRIPTPKFWLHDDQNQAVTGLSEILEPGQISRLSLSQDTAFRVNFADKIPPRQQLYWRGPVFWFTDGKRWTLPKQEPSVQPIIRFAASSYHYIMILEPHQQRWLFALDLPLTIPANAYWTNEWVILSQSKVRKRLAYELDSSPGYATDYLSEHDHARGLQLPRKPSRRIVELVEKWQQHSRDPAQIAHDALRYFHDEPFVYTLTPPLLNQNPTEEFLFETRRGFCEHYSTAFVYLMRAAGIPARVVTGYQGGEFNAIGNFMEVRQADAHAWAEIWLETQGWVRYDPTAAVAPERIEFGIDVGEQIKTGSVAFTVDQLSGLTQWLIQARQLWASFDHAWSRWVLGYDVYSQNRLLRWLGIDNLPSKILISFTIFFALMMLIAPFIFRNKHRKKEKTLILYEKFCKRLARKGLLKNPQEGARNFSLRAATVLPGSAIRIYEITDVYLHLRYGRNPVPGDITRLKQLIAKFKT